MSINVHSPASTGFVRDHAPRPVSRVPAVSPVPVVSRAPAVSRLPRVTLRGIQIALGCLWLLDGLLQFQSYMYSHAFVSQVLEINAAGQPSFVGGPILTLAHLYGRDLALWNTLAALTQCMIGLGLIINQRTVRLALLASFGWAFMVWWFGEGFGMLLSGTPVSPLLGAPGAAIVYALIGVLVWPASRRRERRAAGGALLRNRRGLIVWSVLWLEAAALWLANVNRSRNAIHDQLLGAAAGAPHLLASWQRSVAAATQGHGTTIALLLALVSIAIAAGVWTSRLRVVTIAAGIVLSLAYWVLGQNLGVPFWGGNATDVNSGPLFLLLALALLPAISSPRVRARRRQDVSSALEVGDQQAEVVLVGARH